MPTNAELYGVIQPHGEVVGRVLVALLKKAWVVLAEDPQTANHVNRLALAYKLIRAPESVDASAWRLILSNATVQGDIDNGFVNVTDSDFDWMWLSDTTGLYDHLANLEV